MRKKILTILRFSEWTLLILFTGFGVLISLPFSDTFNFEKDIRQAKREGVYFDADTHFQTYFNISVRLDGVVYDQKEILVYMTGKQLGPYAKLPNKILVTTDTGATFESMGGGSTTNAFRSRGYFHLKVVPPGIKSITVHNEAFSESFSFNIALQGGDPS
ncbi:hypothetical protein [Paenibacillus ginsengarvi]|uniref:DUF4179 domain-containing protein n=1 Tax=Paenibacillus ginsengarvi TaxID=400777 RepID=A0A3B0AIB8_9BACL|nr:hypothetical protein [Paenibacillus ginsengarvi]RKN60051.1 hypothetical protein D7M11_35950 [Paenibacillus ginsengarvi]